MSLIYASTTLRPSKLELLAEWLPTQSWFAGDVALLTSLGAYRFDDPEGEVGVEGHLLSAGDDTVYHVPLTYRGAELEDGEPFLVGTMEHGVLGTRWVSDATGDPVYRSALAAAIAQGGHEAELVAENAEGQRTVRGSTTHVRGSGSAGSPVPELWAASVEVLGGAVRIEAPLATLDVFRGLDREATPLAGSEVLWGTWPGQLDPVMLASLTV
ncbi:hypothetical protein G7066_11885 [Leucobacter coleopterorum]|uniref:Maltokinase N-terminal cap domain-containing protein n=1 Tax=Leucobacter coleopterorum TaxID=2714933 RepID=A0ABX6K220_9MICO|nr:hypothetical protein [Leucobacter coleopterorum]QIM19085.1 hypothetical protein G7066_11885 [Leucobacter coleopterorum]